MSKHNTCRTCKHWSRVDPPGRALSSDDNPMEKCRRYAPKPVQIPRDITLGGVREAIEVIYEVNWPLAYADEWCGEWAGR